MDIERNTQRRTGGQAKHMRYESIDKSSDGIRMLTLYKGRSRDPIKLTLEHTTISAAGSYVALSYCWGPFHDTLDVILDNQPVAVQKNLWQFLKSIQGLMASPSIQVWVDALSIDQRKS